MTEPNAVFVAAMKDVLTVYSRVYDEDYSVVCMDEKPVQFIANARKSIRSKNGIIEYEDNEYTSNGTASIFMFTEPLTDDIMLRQKNTEPERVGQKKIE